MEMKAYLSELGRAVDSYLARCLHDSNVPPMLLEAMEYSLLAGGKRLRPALCLVWAEMFGARRDDILPAAAALECVHTYSLIHDDLPAMDNDDLRRGKPSSHKQFGEALAILAGDGLLTEAFGLLLSTKAPAEQVLQAGQRLALAAGVSGMVGGQTLDMQWTGQGQITLDDVSRMQDLKTGAMLQASCECGVILAGGTKADVQRASNYGIHIGRAFQIADDILDVTGDAKTMGKPAGSDEDKGKITYPSLIGVGPSREQAERFRDLAVQALEGLAGPQADFLRELAAYVVTRAS
ncbi:MAG TPA: polyprenyl synthetase family protein [Desulfonatronum sp.]|nr:polyprenyl synthetase family protein [Desulfonatronum sp.]